MNYKYFVIIIILQFLFKGLLNIWILEFLHHVIVFRWIIEHIDHARDVLHDASIILLLRL